MLLLSKYLVYTALNMGTHITTTQLPSEGPRAVSPRLWCLLVVLLGLLAHHGVIGNEFVSLDTGLAVRDNPHVRDGLTWTSVVWAFTDATTYYDYWHPLSWLSHLMDIELFGMNPAGHHLSSLAIHLANVALLFLLMWRLTRREWIAVVTAGLFGVHPVHVESVAWVVERKDVLSMFFGLLSTLAWLKWVNSTRARWLVAAAGGFVLTLMAKPMLVTLPVLLLLLDFWPLNRFPRATQLLRPGNRTVILEKVPFLAISMVAGLFTLWVFATQGNIVSVHHLGVGERAATAVCGYATYVRKLLFPFDLAVYYPLPDHIPAVRVALSALMLAGVTCVAVALAQSKPFLLTGWSWFVLALIPVSGLVQVGSQYIADRFLYQPAVGLYMVAGVAVDSLVRRRCGRRCAVLAVVVLSGLCARSMRQVTFWRDTESLYHQALAVTRENSLIHFNLGTLYEGEGKNHRAAEQYRLAYEANPRFHQALHRMAVSVLRQGQADSAATILDTLLTVLEPRAEVLVTRGDVALVRGRTRAAIGYYTHAVEVADTFWLAHRGLGLAASALGEHRAAVGYFARATQLAPDNTHLRCLLGDELLACGEPDLALRQYATVLRTGRTAVCAQIGLARVYLAQGDTAAARALAGRIARVTPDDRHVRGLLKLLEDSK